MSDEKISKAMIEKLSMDELADVKIEADELSNDLDEIIKKCDEVLNS